MQFPDGRLRNSAKSTVTQQDINQSIPADQFDIVFPHGTYLMNFVTGENYIIKSDGDKRPVQNEELRLTYEQLNSSEPGELAGQKPPFFRRWWAWLLAVTLVGILLIFYRVWRKQLHLRRHGPSQYDSHL